MANMHQQAVFSWLYGTNERRRNAILDVRDQGQTDCCYAFAIVDALYALQYLSTGHALKGSEQDFLDFLHHFCEPPGKVEYENGYIKISERGISNSLENAFAYIQFWGLLLEEDYTFKKKCQNPGGINYLKAARPEGTVQLSAEFITVEDDHIFLVGNGYFGGFIKTQPVIASVYCTESFKSYGAQDGIYDYALDEWKDIWKAEKRHDKEAYPEHVLLIVGYGEENGIQYYVGKNSWGPEWGHEGFIKLKMSCVEGLGGFHYPLPPVTTLKQLGS